MKKAPTCLGAGLIALDVILNGSPSTLPKLSAGGSCGNVLAILSYLGWDSYPLARLANDQAGAALLIDLDRWHIHTDYISINNEGSTPIIIHRILKDKTGKPVHRFEFRDPDTKSWLPQFKAITKNIASKVILENPLPQVFYFDRVNPGTFDLATYLKARGTVIFFEPSFIKDQKQFEKFLAIADIVKFSHDRIPDFKERYPTIECFLEIETLGKDGLSYRCINNSNPNEWVTIKAFRLDHIQDAAGAGDWCSAGIIKSLCTDGHISLFGADTKQIKKAFLYGQVLGALNCLYDGARGLMYHYTPEQLMPLVDQFVTEKKVGKLDFVKKPLIDISTEVSFSELYRLV